MKTDRKRMPAYLILLSICIMLFFWPGFPGIDEQTTQSSEDWKAGVIHYNSPSLIETVSAFSGGSSQINSTYESDGRNKQLKGSVEAATSGNNDDIEYLVMDSFYTASDKFQGTGSVMNDFNIKIYDLITDPDLADPRYCGKEKGVKITINYNNSQNKLHNTLWGYEVDATRIAESFYSGELKDKIGFVAINFREDNSDSKKFCLLLDAEDVKQFQDKWTDNSFIKCTGWTKINFDPKSGISYYEEPATLMTGTSTEELPNSYANAVSTSSQADFKAKIHETTISLSLIIEKISDMSAKNKFDKMASLSNEMILEANKAEDEVRNLSLPAEFENARSEYLKGIEYYLAAGSELWYGAAFTDPQKLGQGEDSLRDAMEHINNALKQMNLRQIEKSAVKVSSKELFPGALKLRESYDYRDSREANDISAKIEYVTFRDDYSLDGLDNKEQIKSGYGKKFLFANIEVTHLGYRGGGSSKVTTPKPDAFTLIYNGDTIKQTPTSDFIKTVGHPYKKVTINRKERTEGLLVFLVPDDINTEDAYIQLNLNSKEKPVWHLIN